MILNILALLDIPVKNQIILGAFQSGGDDLSRPRKAWKKGDFVRWAQPHRTKCLGGKAFAR